MADKTCFFLSHLGRSDSPPNAGAEVVFETLIVPAMESFPEFRLVHYQYESEPGSINAAFLDHVLTADLIIADLTDLTSSGYYQLGVRHAAQLPTVLIAQDDHVISFDMRDFRYVRYPYDRPRDSKEQRASLDALIEAVRSVLETTERPSTTLPQGRPTHRQPGLELAERIREAADARPCALILIPQKLISNLWSDIGRRLH